MSNKVYVLKNDDVVCTSSSSLMYQCTFKVSEYLAIIQTKLEAEQLLEEGLECEILRPSKPWIKGKIKLRLEFEIDEAETEDLDEGKGVDNNLENNGTDTTTPVTTVPAVTDQNQAEQDDLENFPRAEGMWS
ncbi:MAG: KGK domain-containing protein [Cyanobacteriota bacterium]|nr:KGK domain-containing protein [Cyanobacteriota bacterium]